MIPSGARTCRVDGDEVRIFTRNGHDWTDKLPKQVEAIKELGLESAWLDGEIVVHNSEGVPDFQLLQNAFDAGKSHGIIYYLFDLPYLNGGDLREVPVHSVPCGLDSTRVASCGASFWGRGARTASRFPLGCTPAWLSFWSA